MSPFGIVLDKEMRSKGISKTELGSRLDVSPSTVTQYFRGAPNLDTIFKIGTAIETDLPDKPRVVSGEVHLFTSSRLSIVSDHSTILGTIVVRHISSADFSTTACV